MDDKLVSDTVSKSVFDPNIVTHDPKNVSEGESPDIPQKQTKSSDNISASEGESPQKQVRYSDNISASEGDSNKNDNI